MPAPFGVTPEGFSRPSVQELIGLCEADERADISPTIDVAPDQIVGQLNGIFNNRLGVAWEALEAVHDGNDPDRAEDDQLISLSKITGTNAEGASKSFVVESVTLEVGTGLQAGVHFAHVQGKPAVRFTPKVDFTAPGPGSPATYLVTFEAENAGPVQVAANTLNVIATPIDGWTATNNGADATIGRNADDNEQLRLRREQGVQRSGSSTRDAVRADVLAVDKVTSCQVFENYTDETDANGLPPKSFEVVLWDDAGADDDAVAQAIWGSKPGGIQPIGAETGTAVDKKGKPQVMRFSRATAVPIYLEFDLKKREGYVGDTDYKLDVATSLNVEFGTGESVDFYDVLIATQGLGAKVSAVRIGTAPSPTGDDEVPISNLQIARFDSSRIVLNVSL